MRMLRGIQRDVELEQLPVHIDADDLLMFINKHDVIHDGVTNNDMIDIVAFEYRIQLLSGGQATPCICMLREVAAIPHRSLLVPDQLRGKIRAVWPGWRAQARANALIDRIMRKRQTVQLR